MKKTENGKYPFKRCPLIIKYVCNLCGNSIKKLYGQNDKVAGFLNCSCYGVMEKELPDISTSSVEIVDTGTMVRKVELRKDAVYKAKEKGDTYSKTMDQRDRILKKEDNGNNS
jgi:hypothetical protein